MSLWNSTQQKLELLCQASFCQGLPWEALLELAESFEGHHYESGQTVGDFVLVPVDGSVWPASQLGWKESVDAVLAGDCQVLRLERRLFLQALERFPEITARLLQGPA